MDWWEGNGKGFGVFLHIFLEHNSFGSFRYVFLFLLFGGPPTFFISGVFGGCQAVCPTFRSSIVSCLLVVILPNAIFFGEFIVSCRGMLHLLYISVVVIVVVFVVVGVHVVVVL